MAESCFRLVVPHQCCVCLVCDGLDLHTIGKPGPIYTRSYQLFFYTYIASVPLTKSILSLLHVVVCILKSMVQ